MYCIKKSVQTIMFGPCHLGEFAPYQHMRNESDADYEGVCAGDTSLTLYSCRLIHPQSRFAQGEPTKVSEICSDS
jgi:hypothetical protein